MAAAIAAFVGLNAWKKQGVWQADSELARQILVSLYKYRDTLYAVRHPAMSHSEMECDFGAQGSLTDRQKRSQGIINAYAKRWERHYEKRAELNALLIESDAVWESALSELVDEVKNLEHELFTYIMIYLDASHREYSDQTMNESYREVLSKKRDILYDLLDESDDYRSDFNRLLKPVEAYLRKKLGRGR